MNRIFCFVLLTVKVGIYDQLNPCMNKPKNESHFHIVSRDLNAALFSDNACHSP